MIDIIINKVVIHALVKEQHEAIQPSKIRPTVLNARDDTVGKTVTGVVAIYGTRNNSAHYGIFKTSEGRGAFPDKFEQYALIAKPTDVQFLDLTHTAMQRLYDKASAIHASSGGYLLFADYSNTQGRYFLIAMVKQKPGITLTEQLEPEELMQLDLSRLNQAARISFGKLSAYRAAEEEDRQELSYLSFVSPSTTKTAAGYFVTALGCSEGAAAAQATKTLIREGRRFFHETEGLQAQGEAFNSALLEYLQKKEEAAESVKFSEIENLVRRHIPETMAEKAEELVDGFITRLNSEDCGVPVEFPVSRTALRRFTHISGESRRWKMVFDRSALGTDPAAEVFYDADSHKITVRNIPENMLKIIEDEITSRNRGEGG
jgi:nucleoid-associated protein